MGFGWAPLASPDYLRAQREAVALRDWATLLFLNHAWNDPHVVLEAPSDDGTALPGIWRARGTAGRPQGCQLVRMWIMLAGHGSAD